MTEVNVTPCVPCYKYALLSKLSAGDFFHLNGNLYVIADSLKIQGDNIKCICLTDNYTTVHIISIYTLIAVVKHVDINYSIEPDIPKDDGNNE